MDNENEVGGYVPASVGDIDGFADLLHQTLEGYVSQGRKLIEFSDTHTADECARAVAPLNERIAALEAQVALSTQAGGVEDMLLRVLHGSALDQVQPQPAEVLLGLVSVAKKYCAPKCAKAITDLANHAATLEAQGAAQGGAKTVELSEDDVEWIVNDMGELGVRVGGKCFFCYKGGSLIYKDGKHDNGDPILHRNVGKREFGETVWPLSWGVRGTSEERYTPGLSFRPPDDPKYQWLPLPDAGGAQ